MQVDTCIDSNAVALQLQYDTRSVGDAIAYPHNGIVYTAVNANASVRPTDSTKRQRRLQSVCVYRSAIQ